MLNLHISSAFRHGATIVCLAAGALGGLWFGFSVSQWTWGGLEIWLMKRPVDASAWAAFGAAAVGVLAVAAIALRRFAARRASGSSGSGRARLAAPLRGETTADTSRRRRERTGKVSLQQTLARADKASLRA